MSEVCLSGVVICKPPTAELGSLMNRMSKFEFFILNEPHDTSPTTTVIVPLWAEKLFTAKTNLKLQIGSNEFNFFCCIIQMSFVETVGFFSKDLKAHISFWL